MTSPKQIRTLLESIEAVQEDYNGWSSRETWNVALWLGNEEALYRDVVNMARRSWSASNMAEKLEQFCNEVWKNGVTPDGDSLALVDWKEVAEGFGEDADWDDEPEPDLDQEYDDQDY